ncbi:MAG TPA: recombinase RecT, partial [Thermoanaerobaculaceae bacterium]|nr:recombinase RecT [Thermoanaerobaculaceae bacterium]
MSDRTASTFTQRTQQRDEIAVLAHSIDAQRERYAGILPSNVSFDAFRNAFLTAVQMNPSLVAAERQSLWLALQKCAGDGLKPDGREAALVIFNQEEDEDGNPLPATTGGKARRVVYMPMIRGLIKLVRNTGQIASIDATLIYEGDTVRVWHEDGERHFRHESPFGRDFDDSPERIIGAIAVVRYKDGGWELERMSRRQIDRVRAVSRAKKGPWLPWYDEMARKTVLRRLIKRLDTSSDLRRLDEVLDHDSTMTIDGVATPGDSAIAGTAVTEFREAPQSQERPVPMGAQHTTPRSNAAAQTQAPAQDKREPSPPEQPTTTKTPEPPRRAAAPPPPQDEVEYWPTDEFGEPAEIGGEPVAIRGAKAFAAWFAA